MAFRHPSHVQECKALEFCVSQGVRVRAKRTPKYLGNPYDDKEQSSPEKSWKKYRRRQYRQR